MAKPKPKRYRRVARDAGSGEFITLDKAKKNPKTTIVHKIPIRRRRRK